MTTRKRGKKWETFLYHWEKKTLIFFLKLKVTRLFWPKKRLKLPKKMEDTEKTGVTIFIKLLLDPDTKLYYDIKSTECYLKSIDETLFVFLEDRNLKIINSVFGYDIHIQQDTEAYLLEKFSNELYKRRMQFKNDAMKKVDYSLNKTIETLNSKIK